MKKTIIIGANHAGTAAANTILDNYNDVKVTLFDKNNNISYLGCGTALYIGKQILETNSLFYSSKEALEKKGATVHMQTTVTNIDFDNKRLTATDHTGNGIEASYDNLILATGSSPIKPNIAGADLDGVHFVKLFQDGKKIDEALNDPNIKRVAVIGAGYIGVEIAEAVQLRSRETLLFDREAQCLTGYYDKEFTQKMDEVLEKGGIKLHYAESLVEIKSSNGKSVTSIVTDIGEYPVELVILSVGFRPNTEIGDGKVDLSVANAFSVNLNQQTSIPDVYAIGDCATVFNNATDKQDYIALATNAVRSGIVAGHNVGGTPLESQGVQGSNGIQIYGYKMFSTGLTLEKAKKKGFNATSTDFADLQKPAFMKENNHEVKIKIVYDKDSRHILGAQLASYQDVSMGLHLFSLAIAKKFTINELPLLDIFFMPHFNQPFNYITVAGLIAE